MIVPNNKEEWVNPTLLFKTKTFITLTFEDGHIEVGPLREPYYKGDHYMYFVILVIDSGGIKEGYVAASVTPPFTVKCSEFMVKDFRESTEEEIKLFTKIVEDEGEKWDFEFNDYELKDYKE